MAATSVDANESRHATAATFRCGFIRNTNQVRRRSATVRSPARSSDFQPCGSHSCSEAEALAASTPPRTSTDTMSMPSR
ncbi:Uncharacterised protein [Mycobacterium tuberculosis]|nr:Uncharacterised protein [Mycobacterium tuberculosis]